MILGRGAPQIHVKMHTCDRLRPPSNGFQVLKVHTFIIRWLLGLSLQGWHYGEPKHRRRGRKVLRWVRSARAASSAGEHVDSEALSHGIDAKLQLALKSHGVRITVRSDISDIGDIGDDDRVFSQI